LLTLDGGGWVGVIACLPDSMLQRHSGWEVRDHPSPALPVKGRELLLWQFQVRPCPSKAYFAGGNTATGFPSGPYETAWPASLLPDSNSRATLSGPMILNC